MQERNVAIVRRAVEDIWNEGDLDTADRLFSKAYLNHGGLIPDFVRGPEAMKISVVLFRTAFPTLHITINNLTASGDTVELRWVARRTVAPMSHGGQPEPEAEQLTGTTLSNLAHGQITESWTDWNFLDALQHLQTVPPDAHA